VADFDSSVFINCPFDPEYAPLLEAMLFCVVYFGLHPRLANERLEAGENRLDKIVAMIKACRYSIHDLSRCKVDKAGEFSRMNMPFEFGLDTGLRRSGQNPLGRKKFMILEGGRFELKRALSDIAGQDVANHGGKYEKVIQEVRDFFRVEAGIEGPGPRLLKIHYVTFQEWMFEKKLYEGHSEAEAKMLPVTERLDEMRAWRSLGCPDQFQA